MFLERTYSSHIKKLNLNSNPKYRPSRSRPSIPENMFQQDLIPAAWQSRNHLLHHGKPDAHPVAANIKHATRRPARKRSGQGLAPNDVSIPSFLIQRTHPAHVWDRNSILARLCLPRKSRSGVRLINASIGSSTHLNLRRVNQGLSKRCRTCFVLWMDQLGYLSCGRHWELGLGRVIVRCAEV